MSDETRYTIADVRNIVGCSDSWIRKKLRAGLFGEVEKAFDKRGYSYRFTQEQVDIAQVLYRGKGTAAPTGGVELSPTRPELQALVVRATAEVDKWKGIAETHAEAAAKLEAERDAERARLEHAQNRIEALKSLSLLDRLRGKHKDL